MHALKYLHAFTAQIDHMGDSDIAHMVKIYSGTPDRLLNYSRWVRCQNFDIQDEGMFLWKRPVAALPL